MLAKYGTCPMCQKYKPIVKSHLFPRASYKYFREQGFDPIFLSEDVINPTPRQIWAHLLCRSCEGVFNSGGETWLMPLLARHRAEFPLHERIAKAPCVSQEEDPKVYATAGIAGIKTEKLVHVGLGIFWKSSVHHWLRKPPVPFIHLGKHGEVIRKFLRGEGPLGENIALCVTVCTPPMKELCFTLPRYLSRDGFGQFFFYFAGMKFDLLFGEGLREIKQLCLDGSQQRLIMVEDLNPEIHMVLELGMKNARRTPRLLADLQRRRKPSD